MNRAPAYFPPDMHQSIIGADELNFRVREGIGCDLIARSTQITGVNCELKGNDLFNDCADRAGSRREPENEANKAGHNQQHSN